MLRPFAKKLFSGLLGSPEEQLRRTRLIACDLDGTLLNRDEMIGAETSAMIGAIRGLGIHFVLITRRHHQAVELYGELLRVTEDAESDDRNVDVRDLPRSVDHSRVRGERGRLEVEDVDLPRSGEPQAADGFVPARPRTGGDDHP